MKRLVPFMAVPSSRIPGIYVENARRVVAADAAFREINERDVLADILRGDLAAALAERDEARAEVAKMRALIQPRDHDELLDAQREHEPHVRSIVERVGKHGTDNLEPFLTVLFDGIDWSIARKNAALRAELREKREERLDTLAAAFIHRNPGVILAVQESIDPALYLARTIANSSEPDWPTPGVVMSWGKRDTILQAVGDAVRRYRSGLSWIEARNLEEGLYK